MTLYLKSNMICSVWETRRPWYIRESKFFIEGQYICIIIFLRLQCVEKCKITWNYSKKKHNSYNKKYKKKSLQIARITVGSCTYKRSWFVIGLWSSLKIRLSTYWIGFNHVMMEKLISDKTINWQLYCRWYP